MVSETSPQTPQRQRPNLWLVTFGDLLTLLLCLFIAVARLGPLGQDEKMPSDSNVTQSENAYSANSNTAPTDPHSGTNLAQKEANRSSPEAGSEHLKLVETEFDSGALELTEEAHQRVLTFLGAFKPQQIARLRLETCNAVGLGQSGDGWFGSQSRALVLARVVESAGAELGTLWVQPSRRDCPSEPEPFVAMLTVDISHG